MAEQNKKAVSYVKKNFSNKKVDNIRIHSEFYKKFPLYSQKRSNKISHLITELNVQQRFLNDF